MRNRIIQILAGFGLLVGTGTAFRSCESVLFIDLEEGVKLIVLNGTASAGDSLKVQVSRTRHILDNAPVMPLEEAEVSVYENGRMAGNMEYTGNGYYISPDLIPEAGNSYSIVVDQAGYPSVSAECAVPEAVKIQGIDTITKVREGTGGYNYWMDEVHVLQFDLTLQDPGGVENYYLLSAIADRAYNEYKKDTTYILVDSLFVDGRWVLWVRDTTYELYEVNRYAGYIQVNSGDIVVEGQSPEGVIFSDKLIDGRTYSFRGFLWDQSLASVDSTNLEFRLNSISEDYFRYLISRQEHFIARNDALSVPVIVYTNVVDGTGILGGLSSDRRTITTFVPENPWAYYEK